MVTGISHFVWTPIYALLIISLLFWTSYSHIAKIFKWLTLVLFAYIIAAFLAHPDWRAVLRSTFIPMSSGQPVISRRSSGFWNHDFSVPFLLASVAGGGRGEKDGYAHRSRARRRDR